MPFAAPEHDERRRGRFRLSPSPPWRFSNGYCSVTNGFLQLDPERDTPATELGATACRRQRRVDALVERERPLDPEKCFEYLADAEVLMKMTVQ